MAQMHATGIASEPPSPPLEPTAEPIAEISATLLRAQAFLSGCAIALLVREGECLVCRAGNGAAAPDLGTRIPVEHSFVGLCVSQKKPHTCEDADTDTRVETATYSRLRPKSILAVPVRSGPDVVAVLASFSSAPNAFSNTQIAILRTVADSLSRPVQQLPPSPSVTQAAVPQPEPWGSSSQERATKPESVSAPAPLTTPKPLELVVPLRIEPVPPPAEVQQEEVLALADEPAPPQPFMVRKEQILTLADEPAPVRRAPEPSPRPSRVMDYAVPRTFELPVRPRSSGLRPALLRIASITAACVLGALATAGWYSTRMSAVAKPARVLTAPASAAVLPPQPTPPQPAAEPAAAPVPAPVHEAQVAPVSARIPSPSAKPSPVVPTHAEAHAATAAQPAVVTEMEAPPTLPHRAAPAPAAPVAAPALALAAAPSMPTLVAPHTESPKLHQSVANPARLEHRVAPEYPMLALQRHIGGEVVVSLMVRKDGSVADVKAISGNPLLRDSAVTAVKHWRYSPATLDGKPVEATAQVVLKFEAPK